MLICVPRKFRVRRNALCLFHAGVHARKLAPDPSRTLSVSCRSSPPPSAVLPTSHRHETNAVPCLRRIDKNLRLGGVCYSGSNEHPYTGSIVIDPDLVRSGSSSSGGGSTRSSLPRSSFGEVYVPCVGQAGRQAIRQSETLTRKILHVVGIRLLSQYSCLNSCPV